MQLPHRHWRRLLAILAAPIAGCAIIAYDYLPKAEDLQGMTATAARAQVQQLLLHDPAGTGHPAIFDDHWITAVKVLPQKLVVTTSTGTRVLVLKDIHPAVHQPEAFQTPADVVVADRDYFLFHYSNPPAVPISLANALFVLKREAVLHAGQQDDDSAFAAALAQYRDASPKPLLSEDARRFSVQAEAAVRDKDFAGAADLYAQALQLAPWWPQGRFNHALVLAETGDFETAIVEMKRYLALAPDAPNARAAQDEVYEWERKATYP